MSRGLGKLQRLVLAKLKAKPRDSFGRFKGQSGKPREFGLEELAYAGEGLDMEDWRGPKPSISTYKAIQRAVVSLRKAGMVKTEMVRISLEKAFCAVTLSVECSAKSASIQHLERATPISQPKELSA
jgi:hypothetical protein